jgi:hypothetical protein
VINTARYAFHNYQAERRNETPQDRAARRTANATFAMAVFAAATIVVGILQWDTLHSTDEAIRAQLNVMREQLEQAKIDRRAWLVPSQIEWLGIPQPGRTISAVLVYGNSGREPALDYAARYRFRLFEPDPTFAYSSMRFGNNEACNGLESNPGGATIYPGGTPNNRTELVIPSNYINDNLLRGLPVTPNPLLLPVLFVHGCLAYRTLGKTGRSGYCFYLHPSSDTPLSQWIFRTCADGNSAE